MPKLRVYDSQEEAAAAAAEFILGRLDAALQDAGRATLAVSGGSTPKLMFEAMARQQFEWPKLQLFFVDERPVPPGHPDSNFSMADAALCQPVGLKSKQVHRIQGELEPSVAAERYGDELVESFELDEGAAPRFDVLHLGMGDDGHTASLFPGEPLILDRSGLAGSVYASGKRSYRVSLLPKVLLNAANTVFLVTGADKAKPLKAVLEGPQDFLAYPAQLVDRQAENVVWFVDTAAAAELDR
jgi:6-phosphogluconolactonase